MQFGQILVVFTMFAFSVTFSPHFEGCNWGCSHSIIHLLGSTMTFFAASSLA